MNRAPDMSTHLIGSRLGVGALVLAAWLLLGGCATSPPRPTTFAREAVVGGGGPGPWMPTPAEEQPRRAWEQTWDEALTHALSRCTPGALPEGWPRQSQEAGEELLAPFLDCASPGDFVALQVGLDMPLLVERLEDWDAVRLGALGPVRADASALLQRKRAAFLVRVTERYGLASAQVLALFVLHSAYDDEVREVLGLLARDKQLSQTLGLMPAVHQEVQERGLSLSAHVERDFQLSDVGRGLGRAVRDALATSSLVNGGQGLGQHTLRGQLPSPYQRALEEVDVAQMRQHFSPDNLVLGSFDSLTFGVPLGLYGLVAGTTQGLGALTRGEYEQGTRQLAPAALLVALHVGSRGMRLLAEARGAPGLGAGARGLPELRLKALQDMARQWEARLGEEGLRQLAGYLRARREAGEMVAVGGPEAALALYEARGDVGRAQAWLSRAQPQRPGTGTPPGAGEGQGSGSVTRHGPPTTRAASASQGLTTLVDEAMGLTPEVLQTKLSWMEREAMGPRLTGTPTLLERHRPTLMEPPPDARGSPRWPEYVAYYEKRLGEMRHGKTQEGPLRWQAYERMRGLFARGIAFERVMVEWLRADAALPRAQRRWLQDFDSPQVEAYVGVWKPQSGLRFADVLVIEQRPPPAGQFPRVETFSFKSRDLSLLEDSALKSQMMADAGEALAYYGEHLDIRRPSLQPLLPKSETVPVHRVRLLYEGGALKPAKTKNPKAIVRSVREEVPGVEVLVQ